VSAAAIAVADADALAEAVAGSPRVLAVAGATKPALSAAPAGSLALDVSGLRGIVDYDPAELTFTARAGTPLAEIADVLAAHGQYLPFDPPLVARGATLGGTVAAGLSGPGAYRYGGVRDFVLGVRFVDGTGRLVRAGGRVVKNAAGFDIPKLLVGSMGRLGVIAEVSLKVLPAPEATTTVAFAAAGIQQALAAIASVGRGPVEADAVDLLADGRLLVRVAGRSGPLTARAARLRTLVGLPAEELDDAAAAAAWREARELSWVPDRARVVRVGLTARSAPALTEALTAAGATWRLSIGANVAWIAWPSESPTDALHGVLARLGLAGMALTGVGGPCLLGAARAGAFAARVRAAFDPDGRFPEG
jgi:glycolate oxidase FAD binding subunit